MNIFEYRDFDRRVWEEELEGFVPEVIYDMHVHLWSEAHKGELTGPPTGLRLEVDYQDHLEWLWPRRFRGWMKRGTTAGWRRRWRAIPIRWRT